MNLVALKKRWWTYIVLWALFIAVILSVGQYISQIIKVQNFTLEQETKLNKTVSGIDSKITLVLDALRSLVKDNMVLSTVKSKDYLTEQSSISTSTFETIKNSLGASIVYVMDSSGVVIGSSTFDGQNTLYGKSFAFRPYFKQAIDGNPYVYLALGSVTKKRGVYVSHPIYLSDKSKKPIGVVVIKLSVDDIDKQISQIGSGSLALLVSENGVIFSSSNQDDLFKSINKVAVNSLLSVEDEQQFGRKDPEFLNQNGNIVCDETPLVFSGVKNAENWNITVCSNKTDVDLTTVQQGLFNLTFICLVLFITSFLVGIYHVNTSNKDKMYKIRHKILIPLSVTMFLILAFHFVFDLSFAEDQFEEHLIEIFFFMVVGILLIVFFWIILGKIEKKLFRINNQLHKEIEQRQKAEIDINESYKRLRLYIERSPLIHTELDLDLLIVDWNQAAEKIFGYYKDEVIGKNFFSLLSKENSTVNPQELIDQIVGGIDGELDYFTFVNKQGGDVICRLNYVPIMGEHGVSNIIIVGEDLTFQHKIESALRDSEGKYRRIIENAGSAILCVNKEEKIVLANNTAGEFFDLSHEMLLNKTIQEVMPSEGYETLSTQLTTVVQSGEGAKFEGVITLPVGQRWVVLNIQPMYAEDKNINGAQIIAHDVSYIHEVEEEIRSSEQTMFNIFENMEDCFFRIDIGGKIKTVSQGAVGLLGLNDIEDILGKDIKELFVNKSEEEAFFNKIDVENKVTDQEVQLKKKNNEVVTTSINALYLYDGDGTVVGIEGIIRDISVRKGAEDQLIKYRDHLEEMVQDQIKDLVVAREKAEQASKSKSEFLANISHEIRTPLHGILSFADLGMMKIDSTEKDKLLEYFTLIGQSGKRLLALLNDVLDFAKMESGKMEYHFATGCLYQAVQIVCMEFSSFAKDKSVDITVEKPSIMTTASFDLNRIMQVMTNLVSNAIKFSHDGDKITISFEESTLDRDGEASPAIKMSICDQGVGIPEDELENIFDKFTQSQRTSKSVVKGTGLGLAVSREIIKAHNGIITAENIEPSGAKMSIVLPLFADAE